MGKDFRQETQIENPDVKYKNISNLDNRKIQTKVKCYSYPQNMLTTKVKEDKEKQKFMLLKRIHRCSHFEEQFIMLIKAEKSLCYNFMILFQGIPAEKYVCTGETSRRHIY